MLDLPKLFALVAAAYVARQAIAHPGDHKDLEHRKREGAAFHGINVKLAQTLQQCSTSPDYIALRERAVDRRSAAADSLRRERDIEKKTMHGRRDEVALEKWMGISHNQTHERHSTVATEDVLFLGNATCALHSETIIGPYWVEGEFIRKNIGEYEPGVPLHVDIGVVNVKTCRPVPEMVIDIWHANATGIYSGVAAVGQGGLNSTWGRGAQITSNDGHVEFDTFFPGHYEGRASHIHILATKDAHLYKNRTYDAGIAQHIGQLFFDQALIDAVESTTPYIQNQQPLTSNAEDFVAAEAATDQYDIFMDYILLGDAPSDGIMAWITVGIDASANHTDEVDAAAHYYKEGGVDLSDGSGIPEVSTSASTATMLLD